jgi:formylglycine-generating enzyme
VERVERERVERERVEREQERREAVERVERERVERERVEREQERREAVERVERERVERELREAAERVERELREAAERVEIERLKAKFGIDFIKIPGGSFEMGSTDGQSDENPVHSVTIKSFLMSKTEVTVGQYRKCVKAGGCSEPSAYDKAHKWKIYCNWGQLGQEDHPINCVDWKQARTFAKWVGGDLPSEAEWEYAARGGEGFKYAGSNDPNAVGWYRSNSGGGTKPVGGKKKNGFGLYDMSGNVWERVLDEYKDSYRSAPRDGSPVCRLPICSQNAPGRVIRGGSWSLDAGILRVAFRNYFSPVYRNGDVGFRLRRTLP